MFEGGEDAAARVVGDDDVEVGTRRRCERQRGCIVAQGQVAHNRCDARGPIRLHVFPTPSGAGGRGLVAVSVGPKTERDADGGGDGAVDAGLSAVGVDVTPAQGGDGQVEGTHGVGGTEHEGAGRGRSDGPCQVEHAVPGPTGQEGVDARGGLVGGGAHARGPRGVARRDAGCSQRWHDDGGVAGDVDPRGAGVDNDDAHVGTREQRVDGPREGGASGDDDGVNFSSQRRRHDGLLEGGHFPARPRTGRGFRQEREA